MTSAEIKEMVLAAGASATGIAEAGPVDAGAASLHESWTASGVHGEMGYLEKYRDVRSDPRLLLEGARSVVAAAFSYYRPQAYGRGGLRWARYALGDDYHDVVRSRLAAVAEEITRRSGAQCRVCVDTAPLRERYWAERAGLGFTGRNGLLIVPGAGSWCVLGFIITTLALSPDMPCGDSGCGGCDRCVRACPGHALDGEGGMDATRCRSYLTIEYRGDALPELGRRVYGCDICQEVCPLNHGAEASAIDEFAPRPGLLDLSRDEILTMEQSDFSSFFKGSAIKRTKLAGLRRNALRTRGDSEQGGNLADGES